MFRAMIQKIGQVVLALSLVFGATAITGTGVHTAEAANPVRWQPGQLHIGSISVGQGDATLIVSPEGKSMLIDVNQSSASKIASYIQTVLGHKNLDYIVLTHYHADHMGDYVNLLKNYGVTVKSATYDRGGDRYAYNSTLYQTYYDYVTNTANNAKRVQMREGYYVNMGSVTVKCVSVGDPSTNQASGILTKDENDRSIALTVRYGNLDYFVAGDLSGQTTSQYTDIETAVAPKVGSIEVYRVNHHGASYSSNQYFVDTLKPKQSIISVGYNTYGHPVSTVVSRLQAYGRVYQTETASGAVKDGNVILLSTNGTNYTINGTSFVTK
ncbi:MBL fold metallo-hydrolase [Tumebacillus sp. DT12]|uniref:MBL fold metallo-hydrolase n=1 Tax=Tumebacillus lacus TaxID=2995335 RepID=A0ABT3WZ59_9BACL|nr:MBL fold metallo-hydrolase [Tumebacillus lacus]MCX7569942.1 MBL fold metallo-hydrolase [Tumebacillus lacus]